MFLGSTAALLGEPGTQRATFFAVLKFVKLQGCVPLCARRDFLFVADAGWILFVVIWPPLGWCILLEGVDLLAYLMV